MNKIVITGALGHIGSKLIREIPNMFPEAEIVMLDNLSAQRYCSLFDLPHHRYHFIEEDILNADLVHIFRGADAVVHLAAVTDATMSFQLKDEVEHVNYGGTKLVAEACIRIGCPLIFPSTTSVYGSQAETVDEDCTDLKPQSPYAESKLKAEQLLQQLGEQNKLRFIICRFGTIFGTSIGMRFHTAVNKFCWQAVMGKSITVWHTALNQNRPYLDLNDAVRAIEFIIQKQIYDNKTYNVVTVNTSVGEIINIISNYISNPIIQYVDTEIMNQLSYNVLNIRFEKLGFEFQGNLKQGIEKTISLLRSQNE